MTVAVTWIITAERKGYSVRKGSSGRPAACDDFAEALQKVRTSFQSGERVILVDPDGYRTVITRQVARKGWRR